MSRSLIIIPDDTIQPITGAIDGATKSLRVKMFILSDPRIIRALIQAHQRGVKVRIMLSPHRRSGTSQNDLSRDALSKGGLDVLDTNPAFDLTHEKSMVVDDDTAFVQSLNWEEKKFRKTRDYAVVTKHPGEVKEIIDCFEADWSRTEFLPAKKSHLIWCPQNGREHFVRLIDSAKKTLFLQHERYQDEVIVERLVRAKLRGVKVHVISRPLHFLKEEKLIEGVGGLRIMNDVGIKIRKLRHLKLHAKLLLADGKRAIIGSVNLSPGSFDRRRELAIEVKDAGIMKRLLKVEKQDWKNSRPLDLTDKGILADLQSSHEEGADLLALTVRPKKSAAARSRRPAR